MVVERHARFRVMGSEGLVRLVLDDEADAARLLSYAQAELERLERLWSRFLPSSELCRLNAAGGAPTIVAAETLEVVELATLAWTATGGGFDPTVLAALEATGYDRTYDELEWRPASVRQGPVSGDPAPGCAEIIVDHGHSAVTVPSGVRLDLGGIGKGRAADLVAGRLVEAGAAGACVDLGGDVRVTGRPPVGSTWPVAVADPFAGESDLGIVDLVEGAVATSSRRRRRWTTSSGDEAHHLIDPATGAPARSDLIAVTVVAASAAWAEVWSKASLIAGSTVAMDRLADVGVAAMAVTDAGAVLTAGPLDRFLRPSVAS